MNGTQVGDIFVSGVWPRGQERARHYVKVILVGDTQYAYVPCDENGVEEKNEGPKYMQRHVFIDRYNRIERKK